MYYVHMLPFTYKIMISGPKGQNLEIFKIFDKAHVWGSSALNMLPQVLDDVCEQRGDPDDDFEYWMASVPRRGAEIWAAKVFWRKTKKSRKCIFTIWAHPDAFICIKMVLRGTNSSHMKTYITVDHSGGIRLEIIHFEPKISRKYSRYKAKIRKIQNGFVGPFLIQIAKGGSLLKEPVCTQNRWIWATGWVFDQK